MKRKDINILSSFTFETTVLRAEVEDGNRYLYGIASSNAIDGHKTIFNEECQDYFVEQCSNNKIPIDIEHNINFLFRVGVVVEAYTTKDEDGKVLFNVKIKLKNNTIANEVWEAINNPDPDFNDITKFGLSIKGSIEAVHYEEIEGKVYKVFDRVKLNTITITERPSNKDTFLEAIERSIETIEDEVISIEENNNKEEILRMIDTMLKASDVIANINKMVAEFVGQVTAIQNANLTTENIFEVIRMFVHKYEDKIEWECSKGLYTSVNDMNVESEDEERSDNTVDNKEVLRTELEQYKTNLLESLENKISELKNNNIEELNKEVLRNDEQTESTDTTTSESGSSSINSNCERCEGSCICSVNQQEVEKVEDVVDVADVERSVGQEEVVEEIKTIELPNFEEIARTIANSIIEEKLVEVERSYNDKLNSSQEMIKALEKEVEVLRNLPSSPSPNIIPVGNVERSLNVNSVDLIRERLKSDDPIVRQNTLAMVMKSFQGN